MRKLVKYSDDEVKFLEENFEKMTYKEMGDKLGRTADAIENKCFMLGLKREKKENPEAEYIKRLIKEGKSNTEIIDLFEEKFGYRTSQPRITHYRKPSERKKKVKGEDLGICNVEIINDAKKKKSEMAYFRNNLSKGDKIKYKGDDFLYVGEIIDKYRNFVRVITNCKIDTVLYCDIISKIVYKEGGLNG